MAINVIRYLHVEKKTCEQFYRQCKLKRLPAITDLYVPAIIMWYKGCLVWKQEQWRLFYLEKCNVTSDITSNGNDMNGWLSQGQVQVRTVSIVGPHVTPNAILPTSFVVILTVAFVVQTIILPLCCVLFSGTYTPHVI